MNSAKRLRFFKLLLQPASGTAVFDILGPFVKKRYAVLVLLLMIPRAGVNRVQLLRAQAKASSLKRRHAELSLRLEDANRRASNIRPIAEE
ncbi:hypothetical protein J2Y68_003272 [Paenarthrobacter nitroguajacolicus]|nr:hypothetical protein [Paenarthrobacter nitroguajacolicus]